MIATRIKSLAVRGFRAYGAAEQTLNLPSDIAVIWGPNSKGKTSLAEAFEFLLTGRISRRELMASAQDEFADALRNAHLLEDAEVYVTASMVAVDGKSHEVRRVLTGDYAKRQDCTSRLEIDGAVSTQTDLEALGIVLSQPPLEAPVLAQHTLSYIFSVRPQDRATYFKTLLEVTDLDDLRNDIAALESDLYPPADPLLGKFDALPHKVQLRFMRHTVPDAATLVAKIDEAAGALITEAGEQVPETLDKRLAEIDRILVVRRSKTFPVRNFDFTQLVGWNPPAADVWTRIDAYLDESKKVDEQTRQLVALFDEAMKLPAISEITEPVDCPLCATQSAMTPERVQLIRQHIEHSQDFKTSEKIARSALAQLLASADALGTAAEAALPKYLKAKPAVRRASGFTIARIRKLLGDGTDEIISAWLATVRPLSKAAIALRTRASVTRALVEKQTSELTTGLDTEKLRSEFAALAKCRAQLAIAIGTYKEPVTSLCAALNDVLDTQSDTVGWQNFLDIARQPEELRRSLVEGKVRITVAQELKSALRQIDLAKEKVLDDKFSDYSGLIQDWWERLRPDEPTFFSTVQFRKGAKRTIDFKAGLSANVDRSAPKVRDVIAIFSQSQLHCLGLAMFLARAQHEGLGFIVLDDPVLSSDEDYRVHFNSTVLSELLKIPMQVIVLTQDHNTWKELDLRYRHLSIATAQLFVDAPAEGTLIENTSDVLLAKINRARSLARGGHPDLRKECGIQLRDAGERFCKEILVKERHDKGDAAACLTDYDGKTLEWLCPHVEPLLVHDPSHPGKLAVFRNTVNNACHDNTPPGNAGMTQACGDILFLVKDYLRP